MRFELSGRFDVPLNRLDRVKVIQAGFKPLQVRHVDLGREGREPPPRVRHPLGISVEPFVERLELALDSRRFESPRVWCLVGELPNS